MRYDRARRPRHERALERLRERALERGSDEQFAERYEDIGRQVTEQRLNRELSQAELASLCATTQSAIARLEGGGRAPRVDTLLRVANALDCELLVRLRPRTTAKGDGRDEPR